MDLTLKTDAEVQAMFRKFTDLFSRKEFLTNLPDKGKRIEKTLLLAKEEILRRGRERQSFESESKTKAAEGSQLKENWMYNKMEACGKKKFDKLQRFERKPQIKFRENQTAIQQPKKQPVAKIEGGLEGAAKDEPSLKRMKSGKGQEAHSPHAKRMKIFAAQENKPKSSIQLDGCELYTKKITLKLIGTDPIVLHYNQEL